MSDPEPHSVVVFGVGAATVVPDVAQVEVSLEVVGPDPATAYTQGNDVARRVVAALDAHGVAETDRQTPVAGDRARGARGPVRAAPAVIAP